MITRSDFPVLLHRRSCWRILVADIAAAWEAVTRKPNLPHPTSGVPFRPASSTPSLEAMMTRFRLCTEALRVESFQTAPGASESGGANALATLQCSGATCDSCLDNCTIQITCIDC